MEPVKSEYTADEAELICAFASDSMNRSRSEKYMELWSRIRTAVATGTTKILPRADQAVK